jgi:hypothetical protein
MLERRAFARRGCAGEDNLLHFSVSDLEGFI